MKNFKACADGLKTPNLAIYEQVLLFWKNFTKVHAKLIEL